MEPVSEPVYTLMPSHVFIWLARKRRTTRDSTSKTLLGNWRAAESSKETGRIRGYGGWDIFRLRHPIIFVHFGESVGTS